MAGMNEDARYRRRLILIGLAVLAGLAILLAIALLVAYMTVPL